MVLDDIKLDIREWNRWFKEQFNNRDLITLDEFVDRFEDIILENERLQEEIEEKYERMEEMRKELAAYDPFNYGYPNEWIERGGE